MKPYEREFINGVIANFHGWYLVQAGHLFQRWLTPEGKIFKITYPDELAIGAVVPWPDYTRSLDAIAYVEAILTDEERDIYIENLANETMDDPTFATSESRAICLAQLIARMR